MIKSIMCMIAVAGFTLASASQEKPRGTGQIEGPSSSPTESFSPANMTKVTIKTTDGSLLKGYFAKADSANVSLQMEDGQQLLLKHSEIVTINYSHNDLMISEAFSADLEAANKAIAALSSLKNAAEVGTPIARYRERVIDVKTIVLESCKHIQNEELKKELSASLKWYELALNMWDVSIKTEKFSAESARIMLVTVNDNWKWARENLAKAEILVKKIPQ